MLNFVIIVMIVIWVALALKAMRNGKNQCNGDCANCHKGTNLCEQYYKDNPKKN